MMIGNKKCSESDRFLGRVLAGLLVVVTIAVGALVHAGMNVQAFL